MKIRQVDLPEDTSNSRFVLDLITESKPCALVTVFDSWNDLSVYATPANLRAIAAACVDAADELEGKS